MEHQSALLTVVFQIGELDSEVQAIDHLDLALLDGELIESGEFFLECVVDCFAFGDVVGLEAAHDHVGGGDCGGH